MCKPILSIICASLAALTLSGCSRTSSFMIRNELTGIETKDALTIVLTEYMECNADDSPSCKVLPHSKSTEKKFERCLSSEIHARRPELTIISADEFRQAVFPGIGRDAVPRTAEDYMPLIKEPYFHRYIKLNNLHYTIFLKVLFQSGPSHWQFAADHGQSLPLWGISKEWGKVSSIEANILDMYKYVQSGSVRSSSVGRTGFVIPVIIIIPLPPVPWFAMTETNTCEELGNALMQFIEGGNF